MNSLFEDLKEGLQQALDYEKGKGTARKITFTIEPVKEFTNSEIKEIRNNAGMTQSAFAEYFGVSKKTVEAWECGRTHPTGPAFRLMDMLSEKKNMMSFIHAVN